MHTGARLILASFFLIGSGTASWSDDKPLTQQHVLAITETAAAPGHAEKAEPPQPIQPLSDADKEALKETHRVISGKTWKAETPEQRDEHIRNLRESNPPGTVFVIDVRTGNVYKFDPLPPPTNPNQGRDAQLSELNKVRILFFLPEHLLELQVAVAGEDSSQSDRSGRDYRVAGRPSRE